MRSTRMVVLKGGLQKVKDGFWRSRRVLTPEEAALLGKKALTKATGTRDYDTAKQICEGHLAEFERQIAEVRGYHLSPLDKLERELGDLRRFKLEEIADFQAERRHPEPFVAQPVSKGKVTFAILRATWELENTNKRTRRTFGRYMDRFAAHLGHDDATRVTPEDFIAFKASLLRAANAKEMSHTTVSNILTAIKSVFAMGHKGHKIDANPTAGITYRPKKSQKGKTLGYSPDQVEMILIAGRSQPPQIRYPTLIGAFSGARIGELAGATTFDVYQLGEIWVIDIRIDFREEDQTIKTESSIRRVPLHPQIIDEGFIDYVRSLWPVVSRPSRLARIIAAPMPPAARSVNGCAAWVSRTRPRPCATNRTTHSGTIAKRSGATPRSKKNCTTRSPATAKTATLGTMANIN
jgi:hypothetical protein